MLNSIKERSRYFYIIILIAVLDQGTKLIIKSVFEHDKYKAITVFESFLKIIYTENKGAVWGLFPGLSNYITLISLAALIIIFIYFLKLNVQCKMELIGLSFIIGGATGNILDRIFQGYVVDFIDVFVKDFHWATFNVADSCISTGVVLLAIALLRNKCPQKTVRKENASDIT